MGLPVIMSSRLIGLNEFVEHKFNGLIVKDKDYLRSIIRIIDDKDQLKLMSLRSYQKYKMLALNSSIKNWTRLLN